MVGTESTVDSGDISAIRQNKLVILTQQVRELSQPFDDEKNGSYIEAMLGQLNEGSLFPIAFLEKMVKLQQEKLDSICKGDNAELVKLMFDMSQVETKTIDGIKVKIDEVFNVSQSVSESEDKAVKEIENNAAKERLIKWLTDNQYGHIIKGKYFLSDDQVDDDLIEELKEKNIDVFRDSVINTNSLKSLLKDHIKPKHVDGFDFDIPGELPPSDCLKTSIFKFAKVEFPKNK